jgi:hypothetical protein
VNVGYFVAMNGRMNRIEERLDRLVEAITELDKRLTKVELKLGFNRKNNASLGEPRHFVASDFRPSRNDVVRFRFQIVNKRRTRHEHEPGVVGVECWLIQ